MKQHNNKAIVGVSGESISSRSVQKMMHRLYDNGVQSVFLGNPSQRNIAKDITAIDMLVLMGSDDDIHPSEYGETIKHDETKISRNTARVEYENAMVKSALFYGVPMVGVCAGMQRINIGGHEHSNGSLHQHIPDLTGNNHWQEDEAHVAVQPIEIVPSTMLAKIIGEHKSTVKFNENSFHHQTIDNVREGFIVSSYSDDGLIESIETDPKGKFADRFALGVQWHPEFCASSVSEKIIATIAEKAKEFAETKQSKLSSGFTARTQQIQGKSDKQR